jgi:AraC-like DNA-binding protein
MLGSAANNKDYPIQKLAAVVAALAEEGISAESALNGTGIEPGELRSPTSKMSLAQLLTAYRNAIELSRDPLFALRLGQKTRATAYGMYGYAMLSSPDHRRGCEFLQKYHQLSAPTVELVFCEADDVGIWTMTPLAVRPADSRLYRFIIEAMFATSAALARDLMDPSYKPKELRFVFPYSPRLSAYEDFFGCPVLFEQDQNELRFDAAWLDLPTRRPNELTFAAVNQICAEMLDQMESSTELTGKLRRIFVECPGRFPTIEAACRRLGMSSRTLRRKLMAQGSSYAGLLNETRAQLAKKYLRETAMTVDDVAHRLGYSDVSNFRHAFQRWTGVTPTRYRRGSREAIRPREPAAVAT